LPAIEDSIPAEWGENSVKTDPATADEREVTAGAVRRGVNAMLLLMEYRCKRLGV
jgi:hypothetical protein